MELVAAEGESGPLKRNDGQWDFFSLIKKSFSVAVMFFRWGRGSLHLSLFLTDPLCMVLDEFLDVNIRHPHRGAYCQAAITLDDKCNRLSSGMDQMVNGDGHDQKYTKRVQATLEE